MFAIMRKMNVISRCQGLYRSEQISNEELCACHHSFLLAVGGTPGLTQEQLAKRLCLNKSTVTRALNQLEEKGYLERRQDASDKRVYRIFPTELCKELLPRVRQIARDWTACITQGVSEEELAHFYAILERLEQNAKETVGTAEMGGAQ